MIDEYAAQQQMQGMQVGGSARYANANAPGYAAPRPQRRLDAIAAAADVSARLGERLDCILGRVIGGPVGCDSTMAGTALDVSYASHLNRLEDNLNRLAKAIEQLEEFA